MANCIESPVFAVTRAGATLPPPGAVLPGVSSGLIACAVVATTGPSAAKGTGMPALSLAHVREQVFGQASVRKPNTDKTRVAAVGGGARGPHPAREPEPV
jgi:hypothetical protein